MASAVRGIGRKEDGFGVRHVAAPHAGGPEETMTLAGLSIRSL